MPSLAWQSDADDMGFDDFGLWVAFGFWFIGILFLYLISERANQLLVSCVGNIHPVFKILTFWGELIKSTSIKGPLVASFNEVKISRIP